jgi:hypothetical protein
MRAAALTSEARRTSRKPSRRTTRLRHSPTTVHLDQRSVLGLEFLRRWYSEILNEEPSSSQIIRRALDVLCDQVDRGPSVSGEARRLRDAKRARYV